ncbi:MAG: alpha/beta hydrolase-fold protein, partial [Verrucomicrobiota bacterium]
MLGHLMMLSLGSVAAEIETHRVETEYQRGKQEIQVLLPDAYREDGSYRVLYVLPVEKGFRNRFGRGLLLLKEMDAHNRYDLIIVRMGFEKEPWYGDHAADPSVRQASYLKEFVAPFIEKKYAAQSSPEGRLLFGFSKSGWGAFSLILKYPDFFGYAAAWDAPLLFTKFQFGMKSVYGTPEQLERMVERTPIVRRPLTLDQLFAGQAVDQAGDPR